MLSKRFLCNIAQRNLINVHKKTFHTLQSNVTNTIDDISKHKCFLQNPILNLYTGKRFKQKKKHFEKDLQSEVLEDDEEDEVPESLEPFEKIISRIVPSMRLDAVVKVGLGLTRNKVDVAFYESKIRVNGSKVIKKSREVREGDEIDLLIGKSPDNSNFLVVHRIRILSYNFVSGGCRVNLVRDKSLVIEEYEDDRRE